MFSLAIFLPSPITLQKYREKNGKNFKNYYDLRYEKVNKNFPCHWMDNGWVLDLREERPLGTIDRMKRGPIYFLLLRMKI